jgi:hypothetical protein
MTEVGEEYVLLSPTMELYYSNDGEGKKIVSFRAEVFEQYGFARPQAKRMARRRDVDRERVKELLEGGATHSQVLEILL